MHTRKAVLVSAMLLPLAAAQSQAPASPETNWPRELDSNGIHLVIYQPQVDSWKKNKVEARSAVSATLPGASNDVLGIVNVSARTDVDKETRTVVLEDLKINNADFPAIGSGQDAVKKAVRDSLAAWPRVISLDRLLADLSITDAQMETDNAALKNDPPKIIYSTTPAVLVLIDGEPVYRPVQNSKYQRILNTPGLILFDKAANRFYLDGNTRWMSAGSLNGPWTVESNPPADLAQAKSQAMSEEMKDPHDHSKDPGTPNPNGPPPAVYVSTTPAELIQTTGAAQYSPVPKTDLTYVTNSNNDIFVNVKAQDTYVLLAGRWYTAKSLNGPWSFVSGSKLPKDFEKIPPDGPKASVLASIPGTIESREAVVSNQIPQTATVKRSDAKLTVNYDGTPQFQPIAGTPMQYATNTSTEVILAEGRYYAVNNAVWFVSSAPTGPWAVADTIPPVIYTIPPSNPLYHVRYVYVYGATPDYVYFGYTPGYLGSFVSDGVVVFGTGWWYPGWTGAYYYGWPWTWGFGFQFGYWTGGWFWRPVGGFWWYHEPPYLGRVFYGQWNPHWRPGDREWVRGNANVYSRWGGGAVMPRTIQRAAVSPAARGAARGDFYAGRDGKVYEHNQNGWYQRDNAGRSQRVNPPSGLENQRESRSLGNARTGEFQRGGGFSGGMPHTMAPRGGFGGGGGRRR